MTRPPSTSRSATVDNKQQKRPRGAAFARQLVRNQCELDADYEICAHCSADSDELEADHHPRRFCEIWADFKSCYHGGAARLARDMQLPCSPNHDGPGDEWRNQWRVFHHERAEFQALCPMCHSRKSVCER